MSNSVTYDPTIWIDPKSGIDYFFGVQLPEDKVQALKDLMTLPLTSPRQERAIPLGRVASMNLLKGPTELSHV